MQENPVGSLIEDLGKQLTNKNKSNVIFPYGKFKVKEITPENFKKINDTSNPKRIAFVDGGDGILEESPNFLIVLNRVYFSIFQGKKRIKSKSLKSRIEFYSYVVSEISKEGETKKISYDTKLFPYNSEDLKYLPAEEDLRSKTEGTSVLEESRLVSLARRFAEWQLATKIVQQELEPGDIIVKDGSLQTNFKNESKYADELYDAALKKGVIVCGLTKTSRLITESGEPLLARIQEISESVPYDKWYVEVAESASADDRGYLLAAKFHKNSRHVFRFEVLREQFNEMSENDKNEVLAGLSENSQDLAMLGYPYGAIDADRFAQVRKNELGMHKGMIMAEMVKHPEWKRFAKYGLTNKVHDELNSVTS